MEVQEGAILRRRPGQTQEEVTKPKGSRGKELTEPFLNSQ